MSGEYRNKYVEEYTAVVGWRAYQPSWTLTLLTSVGFSAVLGGIAYLQSGNILTLELAGIGAILLCVLTRWVYPMYQHMVWGDPE